MLGRFDRVQQSAAEGIGKERLVTRSMAWYTAAATGVVLATLGLTFAVGLGESARAQQDQEKVATIALRVEGMT